MLIGLSIRQISHYEGFGQYMFIGLLCGVASAISLAAALFGQDR